MSGADPRDIVPEPIPSQAGADYFKTHSHGEGEVPPVDPPAGGPGSPSSLIAYPPDDANALLVNLQTMTDAAFAITIDSADTLVGPMDLRNASDLTSVAAAISNNMAGADCLWEWAQPGTTFVITTTSTGSASRISYARIPATGTDISVMLHLTQATGAQIVQGQDAPPARSTQEKK